MWIPENEADLVKTVTSKSLEETSTFDAKKEVPLKNIETAKDISAMANSGGGVLIYGIDEDETGLPSILSPLLLEGQKERIDAIVRSSIDEIPNFKISIIQSENDSSKGYLIVVIPPSERAPHMVIVKGERRFYGRGETSNYILSQADVAILYERRRIAETSILPMLNRQIEQYEIEENGNRAHLYLLIKPVLYDDNVLDKALSTEQTHIQMLNSTLNEIIQSEIFTKGYSPDFHLGSWTRHADGFSTKFSDPASSKYEKHALFLDVNFDGSGTLFCSRAADTIGEEKWFISDIVAGNTIKFLAFFAEIYEHSKYLGMVDIAIAITGLENCFEYNSRMYLHGNEYRYKKPTYQNTKRVSAISLKENLQQISEGLLMRLINALSNEKYNPFD